MNSTSYNEIGFGPHEQIVPLAPRSRMKKFDFHFSSLVLVIALATFFLNGLFFYLVLAHTRSNDSIDRTSTHYLVASN